MKLRNKKTGEILWSAESCTVLKDKFRIHDIITDKYYTYSSLARLNEDWEDVPEESKEFWYIDTFDCKIEQASLEESKIIGEFNKSIGNWFETKEEAEKAVEKLKAWKRLKDKGFRFTGYTNDSGDLFSCQVVRCRFDDFRKESREDLCLLFSGGGE